MDKDIKTFKDVKPGDVVYLAVNGEEPQVKEVKVSNILKIKEYFNRTFGSDFSDAMYKSYLNMPYHSGTEILYFHFPEYASISSEGNIIWDGFVKVHSFETRATGVSDFTDKDSCLSCVICSTYEEAVNVLRSSCGNELRSMYKRMKALNDRYEQLRRALLYKEEYQPENTDYSKVTFNELPKESPLYILYKEYNPYHVFIKKIPWAVKLSKDTTEINIPKDDNRLFFKTIPYKNATPRYFIVNPEDTSFKCGDEFLPPLNGLSNKKYDVQIFTTFEEAKEIAVKCWDFEVRDCVDDTTQAGRLLNLLEVQELYEQDINDL